MDKFTPYRQPVDSSQFEPVEIGQSGSGDVIPVPPPESKVEPGPFPDPA